MGKQYAMFVKQSPWRKNKADTGNDDDVKQYAVFDKQLPWKKEKADIGNDDDVYKTHECLAFKVAPADDDLCTQSQQAKRMRQTDVCSLFYQRSISWCELPIANCRDILADIRPRRLKRHPSRGISPVTQQALRGTYWPTSLRFSICQWRQIVRSVLLTSFLVGYRVRVFVCTSYTCILLSKERIVWEEWAFSAESQLPVIRATYA